MSNQGAEVNCDKQYQAFIIALIVIAAFVLYFGLSLFFLGIDVTKEMTALLGGYVATVLVYFFGQKQTQVLSNQVQSARDEKQRVENQLNDMSNRVKKLKTGTNEVLDTISDEEKTNELLEQALENREREIRKLIKILEPFIGKKNIGEEE